MANIFYLRMDSDADRRAAHEILTGTPNTTLTFTGAAGWYVIELDSADATNMTTLAPVAVTGGTDDTAADTVYLGAALVGGTTTFSAGAEADTYIITRALADGIAAASGTTSVIINDTDGASVFEFEDGVTITGARQNTSPSSNVVSVDFTSGGTETQMTLSFAADTRFKLGADGAELTLDEFFEAIGPTTNMPSANNNPLTTALKVGFPVLADITAISYTDTTADDTFETKRGTFTATDSDGDTFTFSVADATALTFVGEFTHEVVGTYGTLRYNEGSGAWRFVADDTAIEALADMATGSDTFAVTATDANDNASAAKNLVVNVTGADDDNTPAVITDLAANDGRASIIIHGVRFTAVDAGTGGNDFKIKIKDTSTSAIQVKKMGNTYTISISRHAENVSRQIILDLWEGREGSEDSKNAASTRMEIITAEIVTSISPPKTLPSQLVAAFGTPTNLMDGNNDPIATRDVAVNLAYGSDGILDTTASDTAANGTVSITDPDGFTTSDASNVTVAATYGTVTIAADSSNSGTTTGRFDWTYALNTNDPQTAALMAGMHKDTVIISFTDNDGGIAIHEIEVTITITGTPAHLVDPPDATRFAHSGIGAASVDRAVELDWDGTHDLAASGVLTITDPDGVASVRHNGDAAQYGVFRFDEATGEWEYTLDPNDPQTLALRAAAMETITFTVIDGAGNEATEDVVITIAVNGTPTNTPPTTTPADDLTVMEDATLTLAEANFGFTTGTDGDGADTLKSVVIVTPPEMGVLTLDGVVVTAGQVIPMASISMLVYDPGNAFVPGAPATPDGDPVTTSTASFTYAVIDSEDVRSENATLEITVTGIDDDEATGISLSSASGTLPSNTNLTEARVLADIEITDPDGGEAATIELMTPGDSASASFISSTTPQLVFTADKAGTDGNAITVTIRSDADLATGDQLAAETKVTVAVTPSTSDVIITYNADETVTLQDIVEAVNDPTQDTAAIEASVTNSGGSGAAYEAAKQTFSGGEAETGGGASAGGTDAVEASTSFINPVTTPMLVVTAVPGRGADGNDITIMVQSDADVTPKLTTATMVEVTTTTATPPATGDTTNIVVTYDADASTPVTLKAIADAINADAAASALVTASRTNDDDNMATAFAVASATSLMGGTADSAADDRFMLTADNELILKAGQTLTADESVTLRVQLDSTPTIGETYTLTVGADNAIPTIEPVEGLTVSEDSMLVLWADSFGFTDTDMGDELVSVTIVTLPSAGTLTLDGVAVSANDVISRADIDADKLVYTPPDSFDEDTNVSFTYSVSDGKHESTDASGVDATMMTITVTADDDIATALTLTDATETLPANIDISADRKVADITLTDTDGGSFGILQLLEDTEASASVISGSTPRLVFTADDTGVAGNDISVTIRSDAGLPTGDQLAAENKVEVAVDGNAITITYNADYAVDGTPTPVTLQDIETAVNADTDAMALVTVTRTGDDDNMATAYEAAKQTLAGGEAETGGGASAGGTDAVAAKTSFANPMQPTLVITADEGGTGGNAITVTVKADDSLPTALGDTAKTQITVTGTAIEVVYSAGYTGGVTLKDIADAINDHDMASALVDASTENDGDGTQGNPSAAVFAVAVTTLTGGAVKTAASTRFKLKGTTLELVAGTEIAENDVLSVRVQLTDDPTIRQDYTLTIGADNAIPTTAANPSVDANEDAPYIFKVADFGFMDGDTGDALVSVTIVTLPVDADGDESGTLTLDGVDVDEDDVISVADITAGKLVYEPAGDLNTNTPVTFTYSVSDGLHESTDGLQSDGTTPVAAAMMTIMVMADDDRALELDVTHTPTDPVLVDANASSSFKVADITFSGDPDGGSPGTLELGEVSASVSFDHPDPNSTSMLIATAVKAGAEGNGSVTIELRADSTLREDDSNTDAFENIGIDVETSASANGGTATITNIVIRYNPNDATLADIEAAANADTRVTALVTFSRANDDGTATAFEAEAQPLTGGVDGSTATTTLESPSAGTIIATATTAGEDGNDIMVTFMADPTLATADADSDITNGHDSLAIDVNGRAVTVRFNPDAGVTADDLIMVMDLTANADAKALVTFSVEEGETASEIPLFVADMMTLSGGAAMMGEVIAVAADASLTSVPIATLVATAEAEGVGGNGLTITFATDDTLPADDTDDTNGKEGLTLDHDDVTNTLTITYNPNDGITMADLIAEVALAGNEAIAALVTFSVAEGGDAMAPLPAAGASMMLEGGMDEVIEVVAVAATRAFGDTGTSNANSPMLVITADDPGTGGNAIAVTIRSDDGLTGGDALMEDIDPNTDGDQPERVRVTVDGTAITITYDADGSVTLQEIENAVNGHTEAMALVTASRTGDDDNTANAFVPQLSPLNLEGGVDGVVPVDPVTATTSFEPPAQPTLVIVADTAGEGGNAITVTIQSDADDSVTDLDSGVKVAVAVIEDTGTTPATQNIVITYNADESVTLKDIEDAVNEDTAATDEVADIVTASRTNDDSDDAAAFAVAETTLTGGVDMAGPTDPVPATKTLMAATDGLVVTAHDSGPDGNDITITLTADTNLPADDGDDTNGKEGLTLAVSGTAITVTYNPDDGITMADLIAAATADAAVNALVTFSVRDGTEADAPLFATATPVSLTGGGSAIFEIVRIEGTQGADDKYELHIKEGVTLTDSEVLSVRVQLAEDNGIGADYSLRIGPPNTPPTVTPVDDLSVAENAAFTFEEAHFGFTDAVDTDDELVSITIVSLPAMGALLLNGAAVEAGDVIEVADITAGRLTYDPMDSFLPSDIAPNTDPESAPATFTYTVSDGEDSSAVATMSIAVTDVDDDAPVPMIDTDITFDSGAFVFTSRQLNANDPDTGAGDLTYTLTAIAFGDGVLETYNTTTEMWDVLAEDGNGTFTQQQVDDGHVRLRATTDGTLSIRVADATTSVPAMDADPNATEIMFTARAVQEVTGTDVGGAGDDNNALNFNNNTDMPEENAKARSVTTGIGATTITLGSGNDKVDAGLGDDEIDLTAGGDDTVIYRFATDGDNAIAWSGGDTITGFSPGEDALVLENVGSEDTPFIEGLGTGFIATLSTAYSGSGDRAEIDSYNVTGVEIHFSQAVVLPGGVLGGSILSIEFEEVDPAATTNPYDWGTFQTAWLSTGFNANNLLFTFNEAGQDALERILGLRDADASDQVVAQSSVAIGGDEADTIDLGGDNAASVDGTSWVVFGGGGEDTITLGAGTEEVVYRLGVGDDPSTPAPENETDFIATTDGNDAVSEFTLGTDSLTFVDTDGDALPLADLLGAFASVSLLFDGTDMTYTGISFGLVGTDILRVEFATALDEQALITALGDSTITDTNTLGTIFNSGSAPAADGDPSSLSAAGLALIDTLFGDEISIDTTLPAELL